MRIVVTLALTCGMALLFASWWLMKPLEQGSAPRSNPTAVEPEPETALQPEPEPEPTSSAEDEPAVASIEEPLPSSDSRSLILPTRAFAGPTQYPPEEFAAYGILAFRSRVPSQGDTRHLMICEAYMAGLPHMTELFDLGVPTSEQMVTVWPINYDGKASKLNQADTITTEMCYDAVRNYGLVAALRAIKEAEFAGADLSDQGPFLLAWSPSNRKGRRDALVLTLNLSYVTTYRQASEMMQRWSREIEQNPELWSNGWNLERMRTAIQLWADAYGPQILTLFIAGK